MKNGVLNPAPSKVLTNVIFLTMHVIKTSL